MTKILRLNLEEFSDLNDVEMILRQYDGIQIYARNIQIFRTLFNKFYFLLFAYSSKIKSVASVVEGNIFEDTVVIVSELEDKLDIEINHLAIPGTFVNETKLLKEFYYDDKKDGSIKLELCFLRSDTEYNFLDAVLFAERENLNNISIGLDVNLRQSTFKYLYENTVLKYVTSLYLERDNGFNFISPKEISKTLVEY